MRVPLGRSSSHVAQLLVCGTLALLVLPDQACAPPPCVLSYQASVGIPANTDSLDCTVTFIGRTSTATFACPACADECVPPAGLNVDGVQRWSGATYVSTDAGQTCVVPEAGAPAASTYHSMDFDVHDSTNSSVVSSATNLKNWLGGTSFSVTVQCGGMQVAQLPDQSMGQECIGGD
jgi:hypothetical protein